MLPKPKWHRFRLEAEGVLCQPDATTDFLPAHRRSRSQKEQTAKTAPWTQLFTTYLTTKVKKDVTPLQTTQKDAYPFLWFQRCTVPCLSNWKAVHLPSISLNAVRFMIRSRRKGCRREGMQVIFPVRMVKAEANCVIGLLDILGHVFLNVSTVFQPMISIG